MASLIVDFTVPFDVQRFALIGHNYLIYFAEAFPALDAKNS